MNNSTVPGIPTINHVNHLAQLDPPACISPVPVHPHAVKYDVRLVVPKGDDPVNHTCNVLVQFFQKIKSVDPSADIYPWEENDRRQRYPSNHQTRRTPRYALQLVGICQWLVYLL